MRYLIIVIACFLFSGQAIAQKKNRYLFNSYNSVGFVAGKSPVEYTVQTINGVNYKNWFLGAGIGIDNYFIKSYPLFVSLRKDFLLKKNSWFLYADAGGQIMGNDENESTEFWEYSTTGGFYMDAGIGYKLKTTKKAAVFFSLGNTLKNINKTEYSVESPLDYSTTTAYKLSRISFRMGYQF